MTTLEAQKYIGKTCSASVPMGKKSVTVNFNILDARSSFGRDEVLVTPVSGGDQAWMMADRVKVEEAK